MCKVAHQDPSHNDLVSSRYIAKCQLLKIPWESHTSHLQSDRYDLSGHSLIASTPSLRLRAIQTTENQREVVTQKKDTPYFLKEVIFFVTISRGECPSL